MSNLTGSTDPTPASPPVSAVAPSLPTPGESSQALDPLSTFRLDGRVAVVTGASSGLGARFARVLHSVGATVVVAARRRERLDALVAELPGALAVAADLSVPEDRERLIATTVERFGAVHVLVNNAGVGRAMSVEDEELDWFREVMEINVTAVWHLSKLATPSMIADGGGSIVNIASMLGHVGSTPIKQANYCASKGAVVNLTRELALQWARKGVTVNALCPGGFPSEMTALMESDEGSQQFIAANSPIPRMGHDHELDGALLLLAGPAGSFITGQSLVVDGGWTAR
ncbi:glucose 1-dehydrogenase [soil metagenome]